MGRLIGATQVEPPIPAPMLRASLRALPRRYLDAGVLLAVWGAGFCICWVLAAPFWLADITVYGIPLAYLWITSPPVRAVLEPTFMLKAVVFCIVFFNYVGLRYEGWTAPSAMPLLFGVPTEQALWCVLAIPLVIGLHQRFFASPPRKPPLRGVRPLVYLLFVGGLALAFIPPLRVLMDGHVYLKIGLVIYPLIFVMTLGLGRSVLRGICGIAAVFFALNACFEALALHGKYWSFHGQYVAWVELFGQRVPLEEIVFIITFCAPGIVAVHALRDNWKGMIRPPHPT